MIIADSSVWIDYLNGVSNVETDILDSTLKTGELAVTGIIVSEVLQGVRIEKRFGELKTYFTSLTLLEPKGSIPISRHPEYSASVERAGRR